MTLGQVLQLAKKKKAEEEEAKKQMEQELQNAAALKAIGVSDDVIQDTKINNVQELLTIKRSFRQKFSNLMTNVLKLAL